MITMVNASPEKEDRESFRMLVVMILVPGRQGNPLDRRHLELVYRVIFTTPVSCSMRCAFAMPAAGAQIENRRSLGLPLLRMVREGPPMDAPATVA